MKGVATNNKVVETVNSDLMIRYINYLDKSQSTIEAYSKNLKRFYEWITKNNINNPTRQDILAYKDYLLANKSASTAEAYLVAVRLFFRWTATEGLYPNVADNIKSPTVNKHHKKDHLTSDQARRVLQAIDTTTEQGARDYAMLLLMFTGGLRTIEVARTKVKDLATLADSSVLYIQGKGQDAKDDYIKLAPQAESAIRSYLAFKGKYSGEDHIFTSLSNNSKGKGITTRTIRGIAKERFRAVGLDSDRITAHSTRHTAVTLALLNGGTVQEVQSFARHADISTTMIYAHNIEKASNPCSTHIADSLFTC